MTGPSSNRPYELAYYEHAQMARVLQAPVREAGGFLSDQTLVLWRRAGLVLALETRYPGAGTARRFVRGYVGGLAAHLAAQSLRPNQSMRPHVANYSAETIPQVLATKQAYDTALERCVVPAEDDQACVTVAAASALTGFSTKSIGRLSSGVVTSDLQPAVLLATFTEQVTWAHEAFLLPPEHQQEILASLK